MKGLHGFRALEWICLFPYPGYIWALHFRRKDPKGPSRRPGQEHSHPLWHLPLSFTPHQPARLFNLTSTRCTDSISHHLYHSHFRLSQYHFTWDLVLPPQPHAPSWLPREFVLKCLRFLFGSQLFLAKGFNFKVPQSQEAALCSDESWLHPNPGSTRWITLGRSFSFSDHQIHHLQKEEDDGIYHVNTTHQLLVWFLIPC